MNIVWDPVNIIDLMFSIAIFLLGLWSYRKSKDATGLFMGAAFGIFAFYYAADFFGLRYSWENFLLVVRISAYLVIMLVIAKKAFSKFHK